MGASVLLFATAGDSGSARCPAFRFNVAFAMAGVVEPPGVGAAAGVDADGVDAMFWLDPCPALDCDALPCLDDSAWATFCGVEGACPGWAEDEPGVPGYNDDGGVGPPFTPSNTFEPGADPGKLDWPDCFEGPSGPCSCPLFSRSCCASW